MSQNPPDPVEPDEPEIPRHSDEQLQAAGVLLEDLPAEDGEPSDPDGGRAA